MATVEVIPRNRPAVDCALLLVRLLLGLVFMAHGSQKLFGAFMGPGLEAWVQMMGPIGYLVAIGEFFGGLCIFLGILSRFSAAAIAVIMMGAIALVHGENGFFLSANGMEYALTLLVCALVILICGPGRYALASLLPRSLKFRTRRCIE